ncbi:diacylglycerol kinase [Sphingomicrobium sediminis]|uniref:Diacylglycerol kinase family protein n=1 Tax=Sphingomicrobium sediminis TaxID=2950949 RepID=A0A9X2EEJ3_9SPHN|nr:diacylglycerol kinase family protein [Sphingomicrobium sediminis]MCM8556558.1 diacylglycerol kinase family protein [Sphingomicrobium sediminis]
MIGRIKALRFAWQGLVFLWKGEPTTRFHLIGTIAAIIAGFAFGIERWEWVFVITFTTLVWFAEAVNTAVERLADAVTLEHHPLIGKAKDVASAAVLIISLGAAAGGVVVFGPYVLALLGV